MAKKNNPAVSVIIAMFNAEKYIGECLTSLANQTFQDFEIIVADDCSTDKSRAVVRNFSATFDDRLKVVKLSKNSGYPGLPRNFALKSARGKYVYFLDSDDLLTATALEELFNVAENFDADVVHAETSFIFDDAQGISSAGLMEFQTGELVTAPTLETSDIGERVTAFTEKRFRWQVWGKLFRRKLLSDNKITFPAIKTFEDFVFTFECLVAAQNYVRVPFVNYYYRIREDSLSHETVNGVRFMHDIIGVVKSTDDFMSGRKFFRDNPKYKYMLTDFFMQERLKVFSQKFSSGDYGVGEVYDFFSREIFSRRTQDLAALTSYLFVTANILKLYTAQQEADIAELQDILAGSNPT